MKYYFMLLSKEEAKNPANLGAKYVFGHKDKWCEEDAEEWAKYLTAGYVKYVDYAVKDNKAYYILKTYMDLDANSVVLLCRESEFGCDQDFTNS